MSRVDDADQEQQPVVRVGVCMPFDAQYTLLRRLIEDQGWAIERLAPDDLSRVADSWNLIVLGSESIDHEFLSLAATASRVPDRRVLVVSSDRDPRHIADVLGVGVDDYLVIPFIPEECLARMHVLVKRSRILPERRRHQGVNFDFESRTITAGPHAISFSPQEWQVLLILFEADGQTVDVAAISTAIWGDPSRGTEVASIIHRMRSRMMETDFRAIEIHTERGARYGVRFRRTGDAFPYSVRALSDHIGGSSGPVPAS